MNENDIEKIISDSLNDVLEISGKELPAQGLDQVTFIGNDSFFDSLSVIHFISSLERKLREAGHNIKLVDDRAFDPDNSPFKNLKSLKTLIAEKIDE